MFARVLCFSVKSSDIYVANNEADDKKQTELLEDLLHRLDKLKTIKKRAAKTTHYVEVLMVLDHKIYEK